MKTVGPEERTCIAHKVIVEHFSQKDVAIEHQVSKYLVNKLIKDVRKDSAILTQFRNISNEKIQGT